MAGVLRNRTQETATALLVREPVHNAAAAAEDGIKTCNENGDGDVYGLDNGGNEQYESPRFWQHLSNAGLIEGAYSGNLVAHTLNDTIDRLIPASRLSGAYWGMFHQNGAGWEHVAPANYVMLGPLPGGSFLPLVNAREGVLSPQEAFSLDEKTDDGRPGTGAFLSTLGWNADTALSCVTLDSPTWEEYEAADYNLSNANTACGVMIRLTR